MHSGPAASFAPWFRFFWIKPSCCPAVSWFFSSCSGALLSFLGLYQPFVNFAGAGATVPLLGFGHTLWKGMQKAISEDGFLGLFTGGFTACALGISAALIFSYLSSMIFHPQMKD